MQQIIISHNEEGRRLDRYLVRALPGAGLSFICRMLRKKNITLNGMKASPEVRLKEGDEIRLFFSDDTYRKLLDPDRMIKDDTTGIDTDIFLSAYHKIGDVSIVYEDTDLIFVDKPAGILSQSASPRDMSMNEWLTGRLLESGEIRAEDLKTFKPAFANRLDRNTSGLLLGGKSLKALQMLSELLKKRDMHKYYLCLAEGKPDAHLPVNKDTFYDVTGYLVKDNVSNKVSITDEPAKDSQKIFTGFKLVEEYPDTGNMLLEVDLYTGRSHQIRAQLSHLNHPVSGDVKYGARSGRMQLLHAYRVVFGQMPEWPAISGREFKTQLPGFARRA